jgi:hypothetical protein
MFRFLVLISFCSMVAIAAPPRLAPNPKLISLVYYEPAENFSSSFGHIDLRISYGSRPSLEKDVVVGFGPEVKSGQSPGALEYFGIGKKLKLISWTDTFESSYLNASRERMVGVISMELDLNQRDMNRIVDALNEMFVTKPPPTYHAIFKNCSTEVASVLDSFSKLKKGWFSFHPGFLERKLSNHTRERRYYPSGRIVKRQTLDRHMREYQRLIERGLNQEIFELQIMSVKTEFRILAYRKLLELGATKQFFEGLLETESPRRQKLLRDKIFDKKYPAYERVFEDGRAHAADEIIVKNSKVTIYYPQIGSRLASKQMLRSNPQRSWSFEALGVEERGGHWRSAVKSIKSQQRTFFWFAKDLYVDPR